MNKDLAHRGTRTGRYNSSKPLLSRPPRKNDTARKARSLDTRYAGTPAVPDKRPKLSLSDTDFAQVEARVLAWMTR